MLKKEGERATWEYPFAVAGVNISFMLIQMLDLCPGVYTKYDIICSLIKHNHIVYVKESHVG
jgi:hypothetical protein